MQDRVLYFQRETKKYQLNSDMMPRRQCAAAPHPAAAAAPRTRYRATNMPMQHSPSQPLRLGHDAALPTRRCATARRSCYAINDECKKEFCIFKERRKNLNSTRTRCRAYDAPMRHRLPQPLHLGQNAAPMTRRCATA